MAQVSKITLEWKGLPEFRRALEALGPQAVQAAAVALYREAQRIMTDSKQNYVPVDTGLLRSSGFVLLPEIQAAMVTVTLGYGGAASAYALVQHENLQYHHTVGQAKYLERPIRAAMVGMDSRLANDLKGAMR